MFVCVSVSVRVWERWVVSLYPRLISGTIAADFLLLQSAMCGRVRLGLVRLLFLCVCPQLFSRLMQQTDRQTYPQRFIFFLSKRVGLLVYV